MTIREFSKQYINELSSLSPSPSLDVQVLVEAALGLSKTQILLHYDQEIEQEKLSWLKDAIQKRKTGLPIAYITGHKEFFGYDFLVSPAVLIPKPDTEILVEKALDIILEKMDARPDSLLTICDMCTGSGCIGIAVMKNLIETQHIPFDRLPKITMVDISPAALEIAEKNAEKLIGQEHPQAKSLFRFTRSNLFEQVPWRFDVILTNPPYIPHTMVNELLKDGRSEPRLALDGDITETGDRATINGYELDDGLTIIKNLIPQIKEHLNPKGTVLMETGEYNAEATAAWAKNWAFKTQIYPDLEGQLRVVEFK
ncbi:MAG: peptide chain release factor N(5)-glutamine methyltransferase [Treponema sp.]|nr:peptide chain release factor N(5)-glutamine methyltransferase [Treponema sp.]